MLALVRQLAAEGVSVVYISHRLEEVLEIADTITILRDGKTIITAPRAEMDAHSLIKYMVGRELSDQFIRSAYTEQEILFEVRHLSAVDEMTGKQVLNDISFAVHRGEIVGLAGLMGAGRTETALAIMQSLHGTRVSGEIQLEGKVLHAKTPGDMIRQGIFLVVEDRKEKGLILEMDIQNNITLSSLQECTQIGVINQNEVIRRTKEYCTTLHIKAHSIEMEVGRLSGGNQQKVVLAKALMTQPKVLILDEPTRGIDIGAKHEIYQIMNDLRQQGMSIIMISSELPEVLAMSDRIITMNQGRITGILQNDQTMSQERIMHFCTMEETR